MVFNGLLLKTVVKQGFDKVELISRFKSGSDIVEQ